MIIIRGIVFVQREKRNLSFDSRLGMFCSVNMKLPLNQNFPLCHSYIFIFYLTSLFSIFQGLTLSFSLHLSSRSSSASKVSWQIPQISDSFPSSNEASSASVGNCSASDRVLARRGREFNPPTVSTLITVKYPPKEHDKKPILEETAKQYIAPHFLPWVYTKTCWGFHPVSTGEAVQLIPEHFTVLVQLPNESLQGILIMINQWSINCHCNQL